MKEQIKWARRHIADDADFNDYRKHQYQRLRKGGVGHAEALKLRSQDPRAVSTVIRTRRDHASEMVSRYRSPGSPGEWNKEMTKMLRSMAKTKHTTDQWALFAEFYQKRRRTKGFPFPDKPRKKPAKAAKKPGRRRDARGRFLPKKGLRKVTKGTVKLGGKKVVVKRGRGGRFVPKAAPRKAPRKAAGKVTRGVVRRGGKKIVTRYKGKTTIIRRGAVTVQVKRDRRGRFTK